MPRSPAKEVSDSTLVEDEIVVQSKRIEFYITEYSVELLAKKMQEGEFYVPSYQREFTWESPRKHRFIESLLMGLPIPFLFFWEMPDGKLEIVDGSQRLRTIQEYIAGDLVLGDLESLPLLSGLRFGDLLDSRQRKIKNRSIRGIVLNEHADEQARFDMFDRINTSSKTANKAEIRRGALSGPFLDLVIRLATDDPFMSIAPLTIKQRKEREAEELVTRFFAYSGDLSDYHDRPADFLYNVSKALNKEFAENPELVQTYEGRFKRTIEFVTLVFPYGFRKSPTATTTTRARFEALSVGSWLALQARPELISASDRADRAKKIASWLEGVEFAKITGSDGANAKARLTQRIHFVRDRLLET